MKPFRTSDFLYEIFAFVLILIVVQGIYATVIRPQAEQIRTSDLARMKVDPNFVPTLNAVVIAKDYEQETCFILSFWAFAIMGRKVFVIVRGRRMLDKDFLRLSEGIKILPEDTREYARTVEALPAKTRGELLPRALLTA